VRALIVILLVLLASGCGWTPAAPPQARPDTCKGSDGPTADTVRRAITEVPVATPGTFWVEIGRGHTRNCRLYWVQIVPTIAGESTPQQLLFFDHNTPLGTPTPNPKPYITVLSPSDDTITVQYQWLKGNDQQCCPTGIGTVKFRIGSDSKLQTLGKVPNQ
jgi:LppP/LprE lipoprotein